MTGRSIVLLAGAVLTCLACSSAQRSGNTTDAGVVLDQPSPRNFFEAATQSHVVYDEFAGYDQLEGAADLVVVGKAVSLSKGAVWRFKYPQAAMGEGHRNTTVMKFAVDETIRGSPQTDVYISFQTGTAHGEFSDVPQEWFKAYLVHVPWLDSPEFESPRRGVPEGADLYQVLRPEGFVGEVNGVFEDLPLTVDYPPGPSVYPYD